MVPPYLLNNRLLSKIEMVDIKGILYDVKSVIRSPKGKNVLTFMVFIVIATLFWFLMSLNDEVQHDYDIPTEIVNMPDDMTLINSAPEVIHVSIKDKGSNLFRYDFGRCPSIKLNYKDFRHIGKDRLVLSESQLSASLRSYFGGSGSILTQSPDSIAVTYTTRPPVAVPLEIKSDVSASSQHIVFGRLQADVDTIRLYSAKPLGKAARHAVTELISLSGLTDTTVIEAKVLVPDGVRAIPSTVKVTVPVEPLIAKTRSIPVEMLNVPAGHSVVTFPSTVELTYLLPMSLYNNDNFGVKAYADYSKRKNGSLIPLILSILPDYYRGTTVSPDAVEYIVEQK